MQLQQKSCQNKNKNKKFFKTNTKRFKYFQIWDSKIVLENIFSATPGMACLLISTFGKSFVMVSIFPLIFLFCLCFPTAMSSLSTISFCIYPSVFVCFVSVSVSVSVALICYKFNALCIGPTCGTRQGQTLALQQFLLCACTHTHTRTHAHKKKTQTHTNTNTLTHTHTLFNIHIHTHT